jgi:soluble epoxide hydrolase/lipid-phosphate phosphatase
MTLINRDIYPEDKYPYGQWSYQHFYEQDFEKATSWFDADPAAVLRALYAKGKPGGLGKPAVTATVVEDGGWFGGAEKPDPNLKKIPISAISIDEETYAELVAAMKATGFWGADSWYSNHKANRKYFDEKAKNDGYLHMPTLFIEARFDAVCDSAVSRLAEPQRKYCKDLTEASVDAGHWLPQEKPEEVNGILAKWIVESCKQAWPGSGLIKAKV